MYAITLMTGKNIYSSTSSLMTNAQ